MGSVLTQKPIIFGGRAALISNIIVFIAGNSMGLIMAVAISLSDIGEFNTFLAGYLLGLFFTFLRLPQTKKNRIFEFILLATSVYFIVKYIQLMPTTSISDYLIIGFIGLGMSGVTFLFLAMWRATAYKMIITREELTENQFTLEIITKKLFHCLTEKIIIDKGSEIIVKPANIPAIAG